MFKNRFLSSVRFHFSCPPSPDSGFDIHCITLWSSCLEERGLGTSGRATPSIIQSIMRDKQDPNQLRTTPTLLSLTGCLIDIWECKDLWFPVRGILISNAVRSNEQEIQQCCYPGPRESCPACFYRGFPAPAHMMQNEWVVFRAWQWADHLNRHVSGQGNRNKVSMLYDNPTRLRRKWHSCAVMSTGIPVAAICMQITWLEVFIVRTCLKIQSCVKVITPDRSH